ncbi:anaerobic ribonucleoside-triphosphate reductase activating protein [Thermoanaerobacter brockii subsp. lactiethylicus]|uniref:anaerobic ribonucleoside-triphosphate reductase activating protein n=1 Tax=Thermoanaerobacter sp. (strain X514) TaxID=399726 RepID=UPI000164247C|nr:anaerobic ribonucleoside-triphosphate reductase activating protein [Thermoanaerobacter sp. X514]ABY92441.1 anaerobic ribonucleoside-triphosphate reductase activating protein [Thermoanaerobacter sp. X514]
MIYNFMPVSFIDFPGKIAATVFISGCNFKCPYCHNSYLIPIREGIRSEKDFFNYLKRRANLIEGVCITGGEPALWRGLKDFIKNIKDLHFSVKLDTNGSRPQVLEDLIKEELVDYIAMDIKAPIEKYSIFLKNKKDIDNIQKSVEIIKNSHIDYEFRTTVNDKLLTLEDFEALADWISPAKRYALQRYKYAESILDKEKSGIQDCDINFLKKIKEKLNGNFGEILIRE